jgi:hypothetical protein
LADLSTRYTTLINYFVFWDPAPSTGSPRPGLFFNYISAATFTCTLTISNLIADQTATCFAPVTESRLERTPEAVYSDVIVNYAGGKSVYRIAASTATAFVKRGTSISKPHIGKKATAEAAGDAWLAQHNVETDRITTTIQVPRSQVGLIQAGMRMTVKFSHLADYTADTSMRIVACNPRPTDDLARYYDVDLELVSPAILADHPNLLLAFLGESTGIVGTPYGARDLSAHAWTKLVDSGDVDSDTSHGGQNIGPGTSGMISIWWRWSVPGESGTAVLKFDILPTGGANAMAAWVYELAGIDAPTSSVSLAVSHVHLGDPANVSMTAASPSVMIAGSAFQKVGYGQVTIIANTDGTILADTNLHNVGGGTCHVTADGYPPRIYTGYAQGTGTLTFGGTMTCLGATAPEYNLMGWAAIKALFPLTGTFAVVQQAFADDILGGDTTVSLGSPPGTSGGTPATTGGIVPTVNQTQATTNPTVTDDLAAGYLVGSTWINTASGEEFILVNNTTGAAIWTSTTSTGSWAPTTADYLVGTAQAALSAEIVVGTTPGGELGGTWASPTVDATHSGSAHHAAVTLAASADVLLGLTGQALSFDTQTANTILAGPVTGAAAAPAFRVLVAADIPTGVGGELLITDAPAGSPLVFADILQNEAGDALLYSG